MQCEQCGEREAEIKKMTRSGPEPKCGVCVLAREVLMMTRGPPEMTDGELLHVSARLLALKLRGKNLTEHIAYIDTAYDVIEQVRKIEIDRIYEPGEDFDGKVQGDIGDFAEEGETGE